MQAGPLLVQSVNKATYFLSFINELQIHMSMIEHSLQISVYCAHYAHRTHKRSFTDSASYRPGRHIICKHTDDSHLRRLSKQRGEFWTPFIRFLPTTSVVGSLLGAGLCFLKGCLFEAHYREYIRARFGGGVHTSRVILYLVEAMDIGLMDKVMLIFGMGLYELFLSSLEVTEAMCRPSADGSRSTVCGSNLFGLSRLRERPKWLEI